MSGYKNEMEPFDELPDERQIENLEFEIEIPDVYWAQDIRSIENPILKEREIEAAEKLCKKEKHLHARIESGELYGFKAEAELDSLRVQKSKAATRAGLASVGLTYDHLIDVAEKAGWLTTGDDRVLNQAEQVEKAIDQLDPQSAQQFADKLLKEGKLDRQMYEYFLRQVRLSSLK